MEKIKETIDFEKGKRQKVIEDKDAEVVKVKSEARCHHNKALKLEGDIASMEAKQNEAMSEHDSRREATKVTKREVEVAEKEKSLAALMQN